jgi:hypothetical protein
MSASHRLPRLPHLVAVTAFAVLVLVGAFALLGRSGSSADEAPAPAPVPDAEVEHCLGAGGQPVGSGTDLVCLIEPATLERSPDTGA